jgi:erythronate-4-phosphate dehydrogenase
MPVKTSSSANVVADPNIALADKTFAEFGTVTMLPGRQITREALANTSLLFVRSVTRVDAHLLAGTPVRFVGTATAGADHVDVNYLKEKGIGFADAPGSNAQSVAEYIVAALLHCCRKLGKRPDLLTIGIVGVGNVGARVEKMARALGMQCLLNDPPRQRATGANGFSALKDLLAGSDIVTLHVPLTADGEDATFHLVDTGFLQTMKQGAMLFNASRGDVIDEQALRDNRDRLGALVCDVWHNEPTPSPATIAITDIATPHIAGYSYDGKLRATQMVYEAACAFLSRTPASAIDPALTNQTNTLDLTGSSDPVYDAVMAACPIMADDGRFRKIDHIDSGRRGAYFDELRKNYPKRREFNCYRVTGAGQDAGVLRALGFTVED